MTAQAIASKYRRAMRNGTGASFTREEVAWLYTIGLLECIGIYPPGRRPTPKATLPWPDYEVVYFVGPNDGPVKIGYASDLRARFRHLRYMSPKPLHIWAYTPGTMADERAYHARFGASRLHGEWFDRTPELVAEIERLSELVLS